MIEQMARERVLLKKIREKCSHTSQSGVSIIVSTNKPKYINNIFSNFTRFNYPYRELIIILNSNKMNIKNYSIKAYGLKDVRIFQLDESCTLGECLNFGVEQSMYDYISKMDDDDYYGPNYLIDLMNVFKYTDAQLAGKSSRFIYLEHNNTLGIFTPNYENKYAYVNIAGGTLTFKKEIFEKVKFRSLKRSGTDTHFLSDCVNIGVKMFSSDKYNYVYMKHRNLNEHTWKISSNDIMFYYCKELLTTTNFSPFVIV